MGAVPSHQMKDMHHDAGPGLTVPDEHLSHGCDSANMSGHTIPAVLCGNQCAVLCDAMPADNEFLHGVQSVMTFNFTQIWMDFLFACLPF